MTSTSDSDFDFKMLACRKPKKCKEYSISPNSSKKPPPSDQIGHEVGGGFLQQSAKIFGKIDDFRTVSPLKNAI